MKLTNLYPHLCYSLTGLTCAVALMQPIASHAQRRDFSAVYQFKNVVESEGQVSLTVDLRITNYSDADIHNAGIFLYDSSLMTTPDRDSDRKPIDAFHLTPVISRLQPITLSHRFTVPAREYVRWQQGTQPEFVLVTAASTSDGQAGSRQSHIDLRREDESFQTMQQNKSEVSR